jgi:hypothetical protein
LTLGRNLDPLGANHILEELRNGTTKMSLVEHILCSDEFKKQFRWRGKAAWIRAYLDRHGHETTAHDIASVGPNHSV